MIKVYIASNTGHHEKWEALRASWPDIEIVSTWHGMIGKVKETPENAQWFWVKDLLEVRSCDVLLCVGGPADTLRGALVEAGAALAYGKTVICVGECDSFGTWQHHPAVGHVADIHEAKKMLERTWSVMAWVRNQDYIALSRLKALNPDLRDHPKYVADPR